MFNIIKITDVDSTNNYALSMQKEKFFKEGLVVVSDFQKKVEDKEVIIGIVKKVKT